MKKKFFALMMAMVMVLSLAACGGSDEADSNSGDSAGGESSGSSAFKVGVIGPLTGGAAIYGTCVANSAQIAVDEINALGGDIQFELMTEDDVNDAETSVNAYNALMDDGMQILVGTVTTQPALSVVPLSYEDRVFTLTPSASGDDVISINDNDNVFQICFTDSNQGSRSAQYIDENFDSPKIAIIYNSSDAYSSGIYNNFVKEAQAKGLEVVSAEAFTDDSKTDFSVQLNKSKSSGADLVFLPIYAQEASQILEQANTMGYQTTFFGCDGLDGILAIEGFNTSLAEGVILLTPFVAGDTKSQANVNFTNKFKEKYKDTPNQFAADAYDAIYILAECMKNGNVTADMSVSDVCEILKAEIVKVTYDGLTGDGITFAADGSVNKSPNAMKIQNGDYIPM